jgi:hypothetical protein
MTFASRPTEYRSPAPLRQPRRRRASRRLAVGAALASLALIGTFALVPPPPPSAAAQLDAYIRSHPQSLSVSRDAAATTIARDQYGFAPGTASLASSGSNFDWAKLVLLDGGWPTSDANVTVLTRWMRQENGANDWWNRNNPLNNGLGSGGGGGTGSYANLVIAAQKVAENLHKNPGFATIAEAFAVSAPTPITESAIWASPWASSHYANGTHWHYTPVDSFTAPASAWG